MTVSNILTQLQVKHLGPGKHFDGHGLMLVKTRKDAGKWILRLVINGKRREMGLGRWPDVGIAEARETATTARKQLREGVDPIHERQKERRRKRLTVQQAIEGCFEARKAQLKNDGQAGRWLSPLRVHVIPKLGTLPIEEIDQHHLKRLMSPIWHTKPDAARKALNRIGLTLKHAAALGLDVDLQAVPKAQALLGKRRHTVEHIPSMPYQELPAFYAYLCSRDTVSALALRFLILTVTRTSEIRFATYSEINGDIWTIPPERTKTGKEHRVPLTDEALKVIDLAKKDEGQEFLFVSPQGKPLSDATMSRFMEREGYTARPHGFRASFRTWAENETDAPYEVKESALGHQVGSEVERAYQRSDLLEQRKTLIWNWSLFAFGARGKRTH